MLSDDGLEGSPLEGDPARERLILFAAGRQVHPGARPRLAHLLGRHPSDGPEAGRERAVGRPVQPRRPGRTPAGASTRTPTSSATTSGRGWGRGSASSWASGEVDGDPAGGFRYKVGVQGRQGDLGVLWYYYLVAGPEGDQLLATFTLAEAQAQAFGDQDEMLIGSLRWLPPAGVKAEAEAGPGHRPGTNDRPDAVEHRRVPGFPSSSAPGRHGSVTSRGESAMSQRRAVVTGAGGRVTGSWSWSALTAAAVASVISAGPGAVARGRRP